MNQQAMRNLTLFDLLARSWNLSAPVTDIRFGADGSSVAFAMADGSIAIANATDLEPPEDRMRVSGDFGQTTIRTREMPVAPLTAIAPLAKGAARIATDGQSGFLVGLETGEIIRLRADGENADAAMKLRGPIVALDHSAKAEVLAAATDSTITITQGANPPIHLELDEASPLTTLALSPDNSLLAFATADGLRIHTIFGEKTPRVEFAFPSPPVAIFWHPGGKWLAVTLETGGFGLVDLVAGRSDVISGFPTPVRSIDWSIPTNALIASGAFRIAAWSLNRPPFDGNREGALESGRAGLVAVECVTAHPKKSLVAAGYQNGQIVVAQVGSRDELIVRTSGSAVKKLVWSPDGRHVAIGMQDGAAIVTLPPKMFK